MAKHKIFHDIFYRMEKVLCKHIKRLGWRVEIAEEMVTEIANETMECAKAICPHCKNELETYMTHGEVRHRVPTSINDPSFKPFECKAAALRIRRYRLLGGE